MYPLADAQGQVHSFQQPKLAEQFVLNLFMQTLEISKKLSTEPN